MRKLATGIALIALLVAVVAIRGSAQEARRGPITFQAQQLFPGFWPFPTGLVLGDYDGDGRRDLAITYESVDYEIVLNRRIGKPTAQLRHYPSSPRRIAPPGSDVAFNDFDEDGYDDFAVTYPDEQRAILWFGQTNVGYATPVLPYVPAEVDAGDLDNDHRVDLVVGFQGDTLPTVVLPGRGRALFGAPLNVGIGGGKLVVADINGDGRADLVRGGNVVAELRYALGDGRMSFAATQTHTLTDVNSASSVVGIDVAPPTPHVAPYVAITTRDVSANGAVHVFRHGTAASKVVHRGKESLHAAFGDLNRDGLADLVVADPDARLVTIYTLRGDGSWLPASMIAVDTQRIIVALLVGDISGDGLDDIMVAAERDGDVLIFENATVVTGPRRRSVRH